MKPKQAKPKARIPAWAIVSKAENRKLYKPEPANKANKGDERFLLNFWRKCRKEERSQIILTAYSFALQRIRADLQRKRTK